MKATIEITNVKQVKGFIHQNSIYAYDANRYGNRLTSRKYDPIALFIEGTINGESVKFYSPTVVVIVVSGFINYKSVNENSWFECIEGEMKSYHGAEMFNNSNIMPNVAIETKCEIIPKIKVGDKLNISYSINAGKIKRVKII